MKVKQCVIVYHYIINHDSLKNIAKEEPTGKLEADTDDASASEY